jgi:hypothetical protein
MPQRCYDERKLHLHRRQPSRDPPVWGCTPPGRPEAYNPYLETSGSKCAAAESATGQRFLCSTDKPQFHRQDAAGPMHSGEHEPGEEGEHQDLWGVRGRLGWEAVIWPDETMAEAFRRGSATLGACRGRCHSPAG